MYVGLQKTSLVNFPGRVAATVFLPGCNLRCPFCHNGELACAGISTGPVHQDSEDQEYVLIEEVYAHLEKRAHLLGGLAISGGEPFLSPALTSLIEKAKKLKLAVKIDTNGTLPDRLAFILDNPNLRPDMVAIDIKTNPDRYGELALEEKAGESLSRSLIQSLDLLYNADSSVRVEYRTVLVPGLVGESEIRTIANLLPENADWELTPFVPGVCLDPSWNKIHPYGPEEIKRLLTIAKTLRQGARLR
ncbi:MAG TPA: anaerobic ribonucleoside-triphosphate reductase activating protein [Treponemataceae bacterium]|nr:anaerobic ribonucleoside-triphosphate reductase activating protein [Treponemataceae bacterium]